MTVDMDPAGTFAVVIGIERYDAGWSLDGAARDALRAAAWLRAAGVPADRIRLTVDALPDNEDDVRRDAAELGLSVREATRDDIIDLFTKELTEIDGCHLVVFWSGHGVLDDGYARALFTADAHTVDQRTVRVDELLGFLRDKEIRGFHDQVVIIDACANFAADMKSRTSRTHATFPVSRPRPGVRQFVLYAAAQGEIAGHNQAAKHGEFSDAVLGVLHPGEGPQWPPDMPGLSASVAAKFERLRETGQTRANPVYLSRNTGWTGSEVQCEYGGIPVSGDSRQAADEAGMTASQLRRMIHAFNAGPLQVGAERVADAFRRRAMDQLFSELATEAKGDDRRLAVEQVRRHWRLQRRIAEPLLHFRAVPPRQLRAYYDVVPDRQLAPQLIELDEVLEHLAEFGEADESAPLLRFVARLELFTGTSLEADWFGLSPARLEHLRAVERRAVSAGSGCHLVLHLSGDQWPEEVSGYLRRCGGEWAKQTIPCPASRTGALGAVNSLITWAHESLAGEPALTLGFLVSRARFDDVPERWTYVDEMSGELSLGEEYPLVLHSGDRIRVPRARVWWRERLRQIADDIELAAPEILWIDAPLDARAITKAVRGTNAACVVFTDVPGPLRGTLPGDPIVAAINPGAPYVIWLDEPPADWALAKAEIAALVRNGAFDGVPARTLRIRQDAGPCTGIRVLWDDQELLPKFGQLTGIDVRTA
ncbi:hypothetical protein [Amycolatopsis sp. MtRt-6]|uniref:VMAP-C domain-containing protein n=1 Tax=Amycolatopsis sp. MtRt-6 TaxID=2792782 RepID=UPI001A8F1B14|nr:hypothetical protein [Amycolatopsis sp. MtRt-6]